MHSGEARIGCKHSLIIHQAALRSFGATVLGVFGGVVSPGLTGTLNWAACRLLVERGSAT